MPPVSHLRADALPYKWNPKIKRFQWTSGAGKGQFARREAILALTGRYIEAEGEKLQAIGDRWSEGEINLREFQQQAAEALRVIHAGSAILGKGGPDQLTHEDWQVSNEYLKRQLYKGKDPETGQRYGIKFLAQEMQAGEVTPGVLRRRLGMFAKSGKLIADEMRLRRDKAEGRGFGKRELGANHNHCPECIAYSKLPPAPLDQVVRIGTRCRCRTNCNCNILTMTLKEAIAGGMDPKAA